MMAHRSSFWPLFLLLCVACGGRARLARPADPERAAPSTLVAGVMLFDGQSDALRGPVDVLLENGRVAAIGEPGTIAAPAAVKLAGAGRTLLPGLIDCHVHFGAGGPFWKRELPDEGDVSAALLYAGVTTILSAGAEIDVPALRERIALGREAGPRIFRATRIFTAEGGHPVPLYTVAVPWGLRGYFFSRALRQVTTPEEAREAVRDELASNPADFVKVVYDDIPAGTPHLGQDALKAMVEEARRHDVRVVVHVGSAQDAVEAAEAGASLLMHTPWDDVFTDEQAARVAATKVPVVTTRRIFSAILGSLRDPLEFTELERQVMLPGADPAFRARPSPLRIDGFPDDYVDQMPGLDRNLGENVKRLRQAGVTLLVGTDTGIPAVFPGAAVHEELKSLVALGIPNAEVLRMATSGPARFFSANAKFGTVEPGALADLLLVEGDPLQDITATQRIVEVFQAGRRVERWKAPAASVTARP